MIGKTLAHYRIENRLGQGGMGVVYEAEDTKLKRRIALVVLAERVTDRAGLLERFRLEAETLANLHHGGIFTIHSVESEGDVHFLTMDLVEGRGLDELIPEGGMNLDTFFTLIYPLTEALSAAHELGVVHRDLKPVNILVNNEGRTRVLDFGLAGLREELDADDLTMSMNPPETEAGNTVATTAYLSPEQVENKTVDARSDIFSLGVVMFQMLTGKRPFEGTSTAAIMSAEALYAAPRVTDSHPDLPQDLDRIVRLCLERKPDSRHQTAKGVRNHLRALQEDLEEAAEREAAGDTGRKPAWRTALVVAAVVAVVSVGSWMLWERGGSDDREAPPAPVVVARITDDRPRIAVLPFVNLGDSDDEYLADGLTEQISGRLAAIRELGVISLASTLRYKGRNVPLPEIGRDLGVNFILDGTVRWQHREGAPGRIQVTPRLVSMADGASLWTSRYDRQLEEIFVVQTDIAERVAERLDFELSEAEQAGVEVRPTTDMEAYQNYLWGMQIWTRPGYDAEEYRRAARFFRQAAEKDPQFIEAWIELTNIYVTLYQGGDGTRETLQLAGRTLASAEAINPDDPRLMVARGNYLYLGQNAYDQALTEFRRAEELAPNDPRVSAGMAAVLRRQGALGESTARYEHALLLDPNNAELHLQLARNYGDADDFALADAAYERASALFPEGVEAHVERATNTFRWSASPGDALTVIDRTPQGEDTDVVQSRVYYLMLARDFDGAAAALETLSESYFDSPGDLARYFIAVTNLARVRDDVEGAQAAAAAGWDVAAAMTTEQPDLADGYICLAFFEAVLGRPEAALENLRAGLDLGLVDRFSACDALSIAPSVHLALGNCTAAIELLHVTLESRCYLRLHANDLRLDPLWDACREDPRFQELLQDGGPDS